MKNLLRPHLLDLEPYTPILPFEALSEQLGIPAEQIIKLDANENPYGTLPAVADALHNLSYAHIYPDPESRFLRRALADYHNVPAENILAGAGADELIDLLLRFFINPGDTILNCPPTFGMYAFDTAINGGKVINIPRLDDFSVDADALLDAVAEHQPKLLFLATPNNPDGGLLRSEIIDALLKQNLLLVLDEAYMEFAPPASMKIREVAKRENLIVLRTFSKWAGLAGLRVGYGVFPSWLMPYLWTAKQPYNVSVAASEAALAALRHTDQLEEIGQKIIAERERLYVELQKIDYLEPYPSQSNFILCKVVGRDAATLKADLAKNGILIRYFNKPGLDDHIRISVGKPEQMDAVLKYLTTENTEFTENTEKTKKLFSVFSVNSVVKKENAMRKSSIQRKTNETSITLSLNLDGTGIANINTGIGFFDHMLTQIAVHGLIDIDLQAKGDLHIDSHHTIEDCGIVLGEGIGQALGEKLGIRRMAEASVPMDDALANVILDLSGRPYSVIQTKWVSPSVGNIPTSLLEHFFETIAVSSRMNLHINVFYGKDNHHMAEALFKAFARALDAAIQVDERRMGSVPSSKGKL